MINVRSIANGLIQQVNRNTRGIWVRSTGGYTTDDAGHRVPATATVAVDLQVQGTSSDDLKQIDGLNIQGVLRSVTINGNAQGVVRSGQKGGDILRFADPAAPRGTAAKDWRVVHVLETWPTWCRVIVVLQ